MTSVTMTLNGTDAFTRKLNRFSARMAPVISQPLTRVAWRKLKRVYGFKRDTGELQNSIKRKFTKSTNTGVVNIGDDSTTRRSGKGANFNYAVAIEEGFRGHQFSSLNVNPNSRKIVRTPERTINVRSYGGIHGRLKAMRRAEAELGLRSGKIIKEILK